MKPTKDRNPRPETPPHPDARATDVPGRQRSGRTDSAQDETQRPTPQQPFERDESVSDAGERPPATRRMGQLAHDDATSGRADTSRSEETDATYHRMRRAAPGATAEGREEAGAKEAAGRPREKDAGLSPPARPASRR